MGVMLRVGAIEDAHQRSGRPGVGTRMRRAVAGLALAALLCAGVAGAARQPLQFRWPTSVTVDAGGSVLVVENGLGRVDSIDAASGRMTTLKAGLAKAYAVATAPSG